MTLSRGMTPHDANQPRPTDGIRSCSTGTNLRAYLIDDSGRMIDCYAAKLGVKHVSRDEYPSIIRRVSREWIKQYAVATIVLAGMVGGNLGWRDVPMVQKPGRSR